MIKEAYVSFETARLLKEKGFDEPCIRHWNCDDNILYGANDYPITNSDLTANEYNGCSAPTFQMVMKWLRENYKLNIIISVDDLDWFYSIIDYTHKGDVKMLKDLAGFNSYESACEAAILECLTNLI